MPERTVLQLFRLVQINLHQHGRQQLSGLTLIYQTTLCDVSEDCDVGTHCHKNLQSCTVVQIGRSG
jgi:hypothetical protein